ncbi:MAG: hypothetical protein DSY76_03980 [Bacteroidetes bacterium]|nr:MAG: hypothetical protein DSY76_03980 [Bacteroidota bacterium]
MIRKISLLTLLCFFLINTLTAQFYETGQDPASIHWQQIKTDYFRLVYPDYAEKQAQHFANKLLWAAQQVPKGMNHQPKRIDIIMHMEASTSNAMVVWAPKRMEVYNTPSQSSYGEDWWEQLALHEFRHVVQVSKMRQGFTKVLSYIFGEAATGGILGAYIPLWFLEGDAIATETALSETGRGRDPGFSMALKAQIIEKGVYSYDKAYNGSYRDFVPDHYVLGYHLTTIGQQKYGNAFWSNNLDYSARNPYMIVPFSHSIKKQSGLNKTEFYSESLDTLSQIWIKDYKERPYSDFDTLVINNEKAFRSFTNPNLVDSNTLISLITGLDDINRISSINLTTGKIKILHTPGFGSIDNLSVADSLLVWNERGYNPRWQHRKFMVVKTYDMRTKKVSHRTRYFFPNFDADGKRIVVIEVGKANEYNLVILDSRSGQILKSIPSKNFIKTPFFSADGKNVLAIEINEKGNSIVEFNISNKEKKTIFGPTYNLLSHPNPYGNKVVFISTKSGVTNVHSFDPCTTTEEQISSVPFGVSNLSVVNENQILFNSYSSDGDLIAKQNIYNFQKAKEGKNDDFYKSYLTDNKSNIQKFPLNDSTFLSSKYYKLPHLFNIHSWAPIGLNLDNIEANPGFTFASQNLLSSMISTFGYEYRMNEQTSRYYANFSYKAWYPLIDFDIEYEDRAMFRVYQDGHKERFTYNSTNIGISIAQPLNLSSGKYATFIQPSVGFFNQTLGANSSTPDQFPSGESFQTVRYRLYMHHKLKKGSRDIETRWGQSLDLNVRDTPFDLLQRSILISAAARLYFPGFMKHHTARFYIAGQMKDSYNFAFNDLILFPRGYSNIQSDDYLSFRFDYIFPIFYPDFSLTSLAYFKQLKGAIFFDYGKGSFFDGTTNYQYNHQSLGVDLTTDLHFLRHMAPFELGLRTAYLPHENQMYYQLLFSLGL